MPLRLFRRAIGQRCDPSVVVERQSLNAVHFLSVLKKEKLWRWGRLSARNSDEPSPDRGFRRGF
jgi:hypothetical protein